MQKEILIEQRPGQIRMAVLEDHQLVEYDVERERFEGLTGNLYKGRVLNVLPGMQAAFVDIGLGKNAFLYAGDIAVNPSDLQFGSKGKVEVTAELSAKPIQKLVHAGQEILVQVTKEPGGNKGPRVTTHVTLPGRLAVLMPMDAFIGVSRKIEAEEAREALRERAEAVCPAGMGLIVRTAGAQCEQEALARDVEYLSHVWQKIERKARQVTAPALLHREESLLHRVARDMLTDDVACCMLDAETAYHALYDTVSLLAPTQRSCVQLYRGERPLFDFYGIEEKTEKALERKVWLKSGGYLVIDTCEALTAIDVNTGKFVGKQDFSETVFAVNREAAAEIARQLRLRDLGGIIIIDFIDMELAAQRDTILETMRTALRKDRAKTNVVGFTGLGLLEMTRKKLHAPLHTLLKRTCPICHGEGRLLTEETVARRILQVLMRKAAAGQSGPWVVEAEEAAVRQLCALGCPAQVEAYAICAVAKGQDVYTVTAVERTGVPDAARRIPTEAEGAAE
ncbi:MAG: Rne/Rng family ribonuclease [Clostridia bacterium]